MSKKILFAFSFALIMALATQAPAFAKESTKRVELNERAETRMEVRQENREERQEERQENRQERRDDIAENHGERLQNRFRKYSERLNALISKVEARIAKREAEGKENGDATVKLELAKTKLAEATKLGEDAIAMFLAIDPAKYSEQRTQAQAARDKAELARKAYIETVKLIKDAIVEMVSNKE